MLQQKRTLRKKYCLFILLFLPLLVLAGCNSGNTSTTPTPTAGLQFQQLALGIPQKALLARITGSLPSEQVLHIGITFKIDASKLKQLNNSGSAGSQQKGTDLAKSLGISAQTYQQFQTYFGIENATIKLSQTRTWMAIDIKAGSLAPLLQTRFVLHQLGTRTFYTPDPAQMPKVPVQIANQILAISGLDNYSVPSRPALSSSAPIQAHPDQGIYCPAKTDWPVQDHALYPSDLAQAYGLTSFWHKGWYGQNQKVLLVESMDTYAQSDLNTFFTCENFRGSFHTITMGNVPSMVDPSGSESTLDIEMVASMAPRSQIIDYQSDAYGAYESGQDWVVVLNNLLQRIIDDYQNNTQSGTVVSISLQAPETGLSQSDLESVDQSFQIMTQAEHMSVYVATGDCAPFATQQWGQVAVSFPSNDPWAIGVGGTIMTVDGSGNRSTEVAWADNATSQSACNNAWGSGGGVSTFWQEPAWQQQNASRIPGLQNQYTTGYRQLPDVSASANYDMVFMSNRWTLSGGTSAAAPIVAGGMAVLNGAFMSAFKRFFYGPEGLYAAQANAAQHHPFYDVTQGQNALYTATRGWDYLTGLGSPNYLGYYHSLEQFLPKS